MNYIGGNATDWWKLSKKLESALDIASDDLDTRYKRRLKLGSPVLLPAPLGSMVRAPIILQGGSRELPVAYLHINDVQIRGGRVKAIAQQAVRLASTALESGARPNGKDVIIEYP